MKKPIILSFLLSFLVSLGGIVIEMTLPIAPALLLALIIAASLPFVIFLVGILFSKRLLSRIQNTKLSEGQAYLLKHREEAKASAGALLKKLKRYRVASYIYTAILALFALLNALLGGICFLHAKVLFVAYLIFATLLFLAVGSRITPLPPLTLHEEALVLNKGDTPRLMALVEKAKVALEIEGSVTVILTAECNASIAKDHDRLFLQLGVLLLQLLNENELYCILLHEFSHVSKKRLPHFVESQHNTRLLSTPYDAPALSFLSRFFAFFDYPFIIYYSIYQYANAVLEESEADRMMAIHGDAQTAAAALVKLEYETKFSYEDLFSDEPSLYATEEVPKNRLTHYLERLKAATAQRAKFWDSLIIGELLANNASHPTLKMRLDALSVKEWQITDNENDPAYQKELDTVLAMAEKRFEKAFAISYANDRKERYLDPLARIAAWKEAGEPIAAESYADVVVDFETLARFSEAESLCDRAIEVLPDASAYHAYFTKGLYLLHRYDERGIDLIYHALENNHNYLEDGLMMIGTFCCITGREKELQEYRKRAITLAQKNKDENSGAEYLSRHDRLTRDDMPEDMKKEILDFILSVGEGIIENVYLVRKTVSEAFFTSAFIIHFYGGTDQKRGEIMHKIFRYLDSYPVDWQFSLFDYFDYPEIKVDKIEGAHIYSKKNQT